MKNNCQHYLRRQCWYARALLGIIEVEANKACIVTKGNNRGQSIIELVCGLIILVPLTLVLFDLAAIVLCVQTNDSTCRDAARAAASGPPDTSMQSRAQAVVARANNRTGGVMVSNYKLINVNSSAGTISNVIQTYGGAVSGTVTVTTSVDVRPFIVSIVYSGGQPLTFQSKQTFPFTYVYPNVSTSTTTSGP